MPTLSTRLGDILAFHSYEDSAINDCIDLLGESKRARIQEMLTAAQRVRAADGGRLDVAIPKDDASHNAFCNAFNDVCGFPDETKAAMNGMLRDGASIATIADQYGWSAGRVSRFLNGERSVFFQHGK